MTGPPTAQDQTPSDPPSAESGLVSGSFELTVVENGAAPRPWRHDGDRFSIGSHPSNELVLRDPTVSRFHCEVRCDEDGVVLRDLDSRNGTFVDGVRVKEAYLRPGASAQMGRVVVGFGAPPSARTALSAASSFGGLVGDSPAMRAVFSVLERASRSQSTVLLDGETGTGKGEAALGLHKAGERRDRPFVVVDCGSIPENLFEAELFGHEKGAFTGADAARPGAFEAAEGGTIFLDEVGELPLDVQPKLLRALEERQVRRLGSTKTRPVDVRVIAATNRDLRNAVNQAAFRADLYFRLAVVRVRLPALRERLDDLALLVTRFVDALGGEPARAAALTTPQFLATLRRHPWPGNVRELRNHVERSLVLDSSGAFFGGGTDEADDDAAPSEPGRAGVYRDARQRAIAAFDRKYLAELIAAHAGNVTAAAEAAGLSRVHLYRLLSRYQLLR